MPVITLLFPIQGKQNYDPEDPQSLPVKAGSQPQWEHIAEAMQLLSIARKRHSTP